MAVGGGGWGVVCQTVEDIADSQLGVADSSLTRDPLIAGKFDQVAQFANLPTNASFTSLVNITEMLKPRGQTDLEAKILASASGPFGLGLKLLVSASNFNI